MKCRSPILTAWGESGFGAATVHTNVRAGYTEGMPECRDLYQEPVASRLTMGKNQIMDAILKGENANEAGLAWLKGQSGHRHAPGLTA